MLQQVGFKTPELITKTGFNSSPATEGVLIRAEKETALGLQTK